MANQDALQDGNQFPTLIGATGTAGTAEVRRGIVDDYNNLHVLTKSPLVPKTYDNVAITYPSGTSEIFVFNLGTSPTGTVTITYLDANKGSVSTIVKS